MTCAHPRCECLQHPSKCMFKDKLVDFAVERDIMDVMDEYMPPKTQKQRWEDWTPPDTIEDCVRLMFEILDTVETSDSGRDFKPTYISSCRVWDTHRLGKLLPKMKQLAEYPHPHP